MTEISQKIFPLEGDEAAQLEKQRDWVKAHFPEQDRHRYEELGGKLWVLKAILDARWVKAHETWKLRSLGVTFGDALAQHLGLMWVVVEDENGRDPALMMPKTTIVAYPVTAILKRFERGEDVHMPNLWGNFCEILTEQKAKAFPLD